MEFSIEAEMTTNPLPPHLLASSRDGTKKCSLCGELFSKDSKPSLSRAFSDHVKAVHREPVAESSKSPAKRFAPKK
jgi:hypothetical protein